MQTISPFLWFDGTAEDAARLYVSIFPNSSVTNVSTNPETGDVLTVAFELDGLEFQGLNAGPMFAFTEAISFFIRAETQNEIDYYWNALIADGGEESKCGWLKDRFGLSWQVIPPLLGELLSSSDAAAAGRAMQAMLGMNKIIIADLQAAFDDQ